MGLKFRPGSIGRQPWRRKVSFIYFPLLSMALIPTAFGQGDFTLEVSPSSQTVTSPDYAYFDVSIGSTFGFNGSVTLSVSGQPPGTAVLFAQNPVSPPAHITLRIQHTVNASPGEYVLQLTGTSDTNTHSIDFTLHLEEGPPDIPDFFLNLNDPDIGVCAGDSAPFSVAVGSRMGYSDPITFSAEGNPAGTTLGFNTNPVFPPGSTTMTIGNTAAVSEVRYLIAVTAVAATSTHYVTATLDIFTDPPSSPALLSPNNEAIDVPVIPLLEWSPATQAALYRVELADDTAFSNIVYSALTEGTTHTLRTALPPETVRYWRVTSTNSCGMSMPSGARSFTTTLGYCSTPALPIDDNNPVGVSSQIQIAESEILGGLEVSLKIDHSFVGDLVCTLEHQDTGTTVALLDRPGIPTSPFGCPENNVDVLFSDDAPLAAEDVCANTGIALDGNLRPNGSLQSFAGENLSGTWILTVADYASGDVGSLVEWCLIPLAPIPTNTPTNSPTLTSTDTPTSTITPTLAPTDTPTTAPSSTSTPSSATPTFTPTATNSPSPVSSPTFSPTETVTASLTPTETPTETPQPSLTLTSTFTPTPAEDCPFDVAPPSGGDGRIDAADLLELLQNGLDSDTLMAFARCWRSN